jgi:hypothetical protein
MLEPVPFPSSSRAGTIAPRSRSTAGADDTISSVPWNASTGALNTYGHPNTGTSNPLTIQRTMSVTPVGSMPRSMSPTGALSDDEGLPRRNGEGPSPDIFTDRYWATPKREEHNQKGLNAPYRDPRKTSKVSRISACQCISSDGFAGLFFHKLRQCNGDCTHEVQVRGHSLDCRPVLMFFS